MLRDCYQTLKHHFLLSMFIALLFLFARCASSGYEPLYIISQEEESEDIVQGEKPIR